VQIVSLILALMGIVGGAVFWWYRMKATNDAANEVFDAVGRVRGNMRRGKIRKKAAMAPISAIDDPVVAAATIMVSIITEDTVLSPLVEQPIRAQLANIAAPAKLDETMLYAQWATNQVADVQSVIDIAGAYLSKELSENEKQELVEMIIAAAPVDKRSDLFPQRIKRLQQKLGLKLN
jgi:uncharacterized tellurite resistance protein B-like protein